MKRSLPMTSLCGGVALLLLVMQMTAYAEETWQRIGLAGRDVRSIVLATDGTLCAMTDRGVQRSTDNGTTWTATSVTTAGWSIAADSGTIVATGNDWLARSTDDGLTWTTTTIDPTVYGGYIRSIVADNSGRFFFGTANNIWRSTDEGGSWLSVRGNGFDLDFPDVNVFAIGPDGTMLAGTSGIEGGYVYGTADGGESWLQLARPRGFADVVALAVLPDESLLASIWGESKIIRSTDQGMTWRDCTGGPDLSGSAVASFAAGAGVIYAASPKSGVLRSTDGGESWSGMNDGLAQTLTLRRVVIPADGAPLLLTSDGLFRLSAVAGIQQAEKAERLDLR